MRPDNYLFRLLVGSFVLLLIASVIPANAQQAGQAEPLRDLVQMPIAVDKAVKSGADPDEMRTLAKELNEGEVDSEDFNETMRHGPEISRKMNKDQIGQFVQQKKKEGLRGKQLANSIHKELRSRGIPAGGNNSQGPPPVARDYMPEHAQKKMNNKRGGPSESDQKGRSNAKDQQDNANEPEDEEEADEVSEQQERSNKQRQNDQQSTQTSDNGSSNRGGSSSNRGSGR